jgi:acetyl-CoA C-acetyltransferase
VAIPARTPVLVGVGQVRVAATPPNSAAERPTPLDLMCEALELAGRDTGHRELLGQLDEVVAIGSFTWHTADPALLVCQRLGIAARTRLRPVGGNLPQQLIHESAQRLLAGEISSIAVVGSEAMYSRARARKEGVEVTWPLQGDEVASPVPADADPFPFTHDEFSNGLTLPVEVYPLFENARRARLGMSIDEQRRQLGALWASFATVASTNPYAWIHDAPSADVITSPSERNRMVSFPYTKLMVANLPVDLGAAYIMTSYERARSVGISTDRMIFPVNGADANDHWFVSERPRLDDSPAMRALWEALVEMGTDVERLGPIDLYSCFPTVVQTAADVLGLDPLDPGRPLTLTGGLTFAGGPGNNYVTHSIAALVDSLRHDGSRDGLITGLGWFSTKHSWGTYSAHPPREGFRHLNVQAVVDAQEKTPHEQIDGDAIVESYTVTHSNDGRAAKLLVVARHGPTRVWGSSDDEELMTEAERVELIGRRVRMRGGRVSL